MVAAMRGGRPEAIDLLITHGVDVNARDTADETALYCAAKTYFKHEVSYPAASFDAVVRTLLAHGANPNLPTRTGDTVIKLMRREYRPDLVALMLTYSKKLQGSKR